MTISVSVLEINMVMLYDYPIIPSICDLNIKHYWTTSSWQVHAALKNKKKWLAHSVLKGREELEVVKFVYLFMWVCLSLAFQFRQAEARAKERERERTKKSISTLHYIITYYRNAKIVGSWLGGQRVPHPHLQALCSALSLTCSQMHSNYLGGIDRRVLYGELRHVFSTDL